MADISAKVPDTQAETLALIKRLEAAQAETKEVCNAHRDIFAASKALEGVMITSQNAFREENSIVGDACKKAIDKKKPAEIPYPDIDKAKKVTDKQTKALGKAEEAHKKAIAKLTAAMGKQSEHLHCRLKELKGDEAKHLKSVIASTQASMTKAIQDGATVMVNGKTLRDHLAAERKAAEKKLKAAEKKQAEIKKKQAGKK